MVVKTASPTVETVHALLAADARRPAPDGPRRMILDILGDLHQQQMRRMLTLGAAARGMVNIGRAPVRETPADITTILVKPVGDRCNLQCTYCYEGEVDERNRLPLLSDDLLERIIRDALAGAAWPMRFSWHGGEPLLAGLPFFEKAVELEQRYRRGFPIYNSVQTNGTLLDGRWLDFFRRHSFDIGISIDGPAPVHDAFRVYGDGRGSHSRVCAAARMLREYGFEFGVIVVVTSASQGHAGAMAREFEELGIRHVDLHPSFGMHLHGRSRPVEPKVFSDFVISFFEHWLNASRPAFRVGLFDDILRGMLGQTLSTCYFSGRCCNIVGFEADGDMVPCTRPFDRSRYTFGNIGENSLAEILNAAPFRTFQTEDVRGQDRARDCPWYEVCHNGCPQHRLEDGQQNISGGSYYCECQSGQPGGYAAIFDHVTTRTGEILAGP